MSINVVKNKRESESKGASDRADDSWELLSGGNWILTCCSLGNLLMNRTKTRLWRRDGRKAGRRKPSCVMYGHHAKASISFTKPPSMSSLRLNNLLSLSPGEKGKKALTPPTHCLLSSCSLPPLLQFFSLLLLHRGESWAIGKQSVLLGVTLGGEGKVLFWIKILFLKLYNMILALMEETFSKCPTAVVVS